MKDQDIPLTERPTVSVNEFCRMHGVGRSSFYAAVKRGDISVRKFGRRTLVDKAERERFVRNMPGGSEPR